MSRASKTIHVSTATRKPAEENLDHLTLRSAVVRTRGLAPTWYRRVVRTREKRLITTPNTTVEINFRSLGITAGWRQSYLWSSAPNLSGSRTHAHPGGIQCQKGDDRTLARAGMLLFKRREFRFLWKSDAARGRSAFSPIRQLGDLSLHLFDLPEHALDDRRGVNPFCRSQFARIEVQSRNPILLSFVLGLSLAASPIFRQASSEAREVGKLRKHQRRSGATSTIPLPLPACVQPCENPTFNSREDTK
jgi:hypothetical protein